MKTGKIAVSIGKKYKETLSSFFPPLFLENLQLPMIDRKCYVMLSLENFKTLPYLMYVS